MNWASTAILSASISGIVNIIDSHLLSKRMPSLRAFLLPIGVLHLVVSLVLFYLFPLPQGISTRIVPLAVASGIFTTTSVTILLYSLRREEVSRVIPVVQTYPIFVAILAVPLLGESLNYLGWLAIIIVVAGAIMLSIRQSPSGSGTLLGKSLLLLFLSSLLMAIANVTGKYVLASISFWNLYSITAFCMSGTFLLIAARPRIVKQIISMEKRNSAFSLLLLDETLAIVAIILSYWSIEKGPVALASTILSSRPVFVVIFALILSRILPEFLDWQIGKGWLTLRIIATIMIISGISIIYLT